MWDNKKIKVHNTWAIGDTNGKKLLNNLTEDYCSFEVSKLLKKKRFDVHCSSYYKNSSHVVQGVGNYNSTDQDEFEPHCSRPTHSLVIKWIRENFGIHISLQTGVGEKVWWSYIIIDIATNNILYDLDGSFDKPEESESAALLYTLQNLIK